MSAARPDGDAPYSMMPGRTQSKCADGCQSTAAEFAKLRAPAMPCAPRSNVAICSATPRSPSASEKWVINVIWPMPGHARARSQAARYFSGV